VCVTQEDREQSSAPRAKPGLSLARLGLHRRKLSTADRHKTCIEHHQSPADTRRRGFSEVGRPYIASSTVMPRKYAGFTRLVVLIKYGLSAERFVRLGKASVHALDGFNNLSPFMFPAHAKFF